VKKLELIGKANLDQRAQYEETERQIEREMTQAAETIQNATYVNFWTEKLEFSVKFPFSQTFPKIYYFCFS